MTETCATDTVKCDAPASAATPGPATRRARVAYVMSRFPKITETFILREMIELERQGFDIEVFPLRREKTRLIQPDARPYVARAHFLPVLSVPMVGANLATFARRPMRYLATLATLIGANFGSRRYLAGAIAFFPKAVYFSRRMKELGVTHVHAHFASHPAAMAFVIGRLSGIPYSFVAHGSDLHRDQHMLLEKTREAAFVVAISQFNRRMILDVCNGRYGEKTQVIHCGIDPAEFTPRTTPTAYDRGEGPLRIVCIGTLHEVKGQTHLIESCRLLARAGVDIQCHFIGAGDDEPTLRRQADQAGLTSQITFHGSCTSDQVREQLRLADVLVAPSVPSRDGRREGIPVVLMEAMACGVPCVASRLSGIPELVDDEVTGILTPPGDAAAITAALTRLANDSILRRQLGEASVEKTLREFDIRQCTLALARSLMAQPRSTELSFPSS